MCRGNAHVAPTTGRTENRIRKHKSSPGAGFFAYNEIQQQKSNHRNETFEEFELEVATSAQDSLSKPKCRDLRDEKKNENVLNESLSPNVDSGVLHAYIL
jgi:hypothetical protein